jgi:hypothetical protein
MPLTQEDAARIMFAHDKAVKAMRKAMLGASTSTWPADCEALGAAQQAFADLVAQLTDSEGL